MSFKNSFARNLSGPKDLVLLLKEISSKIRSNEYHLICEYSNNKFIPDSYDINIKGIYNVKNHSKFDYPEGLPKKVYNVTKTSAIASGAQNDFKCYRFGYANNSLNSNKIYFKEDEDATKKIRAVEINGKFGLFKTYFWDDTNEEDLEELGEIIF